MLISIALYLRNRGFIPDEDLSNASIPIKPEPIRAPRELDDSFSDGLGLASTRPGEFAECFLGLLIQPDRNRLLHLVDCITIV